MLREKFPEFCSSPSPPIEGRERRGGAAFGDAVLPAFLFKASDRGCRERRALGTCFMVSLHPSPAVHLRFALSCFLSCLPFLVLQKTQLINIIRLNREQASLTFI